MRVKPLVPEKMIYSKLLTLIIGLREFGFNGDGFRSSVKVISVALFCIAICGCNPPSDFLPVNFDAAADDYVSLMWTLRSHATVLKIPAGLRCTVDADPEPTKTPYGGIAFPVHGANSFRLQFKFPKPDAIDVLYIDAYDSEQTRLDRWQTVKKDGLAAESITYQFTPGQSTTGFDSVEPHPGAPVDTVNIFVRAKPGKQVVFEVTEVEAKK